MIAIIRGSKESFEVGLTHEDMEHLRNGGKVVVNPKDVGMMDLPITIYFGGTHETMQEDLEKRKGQDVVNSKIVESHQ